MTLWRCLLIVVFVHLCAVRCYAASSSDFEGSDIDTSPDTSSSEAGSSSCEGFANHVGEPSSNTSAEIGITNGSDSTVGIISTYGSSSSTNSSSANASVETSDDHDDSTIGSDASAGAIFTYGSASSTYSSSTNASVDTSADVLGITDGSDTSAGVISTSGSASSTNSSTINTSVDASINLDSSTNGSDASIGVISTSGSASNTNSSSINTNVDTSVDINDSTIDFNTTSASVNSNSEEIPAATPSATGPENSFNTTSGSVDSNSKEIPAATPSATGPDNGFNTTSGSVDSNSDESPAETPSVTAVENPTLSPQGSESEGTNEDNVITGVGTLEPSQTNPATSTGENIIRPSDGSAHQLDTNNGAPADSTWSGTRLTAVLSIMGAVAAVAAIAVFVAVRKDQAKKNELGTPSEDYTDDDSSLATPMTHRLDGKYRHGSYGRRTTDLVDASDNTPLASIVVIGPDDDFHTPNAYTSTHQYRSYDGAGRTTRSAKVNNDRVRDNHHENTTATIPAQQQGDAEYDSIFDSSNTRVSFSSSSEPPSYEFEDNLTDSCLMVSATYIDGSERGSDVSTAPRQSQVSSVGDKDEVVSNSTGSFCSSLSSLESSQYDVRDTEASEHIYESELCTNSSRVAMSFDVGSV